MVNSVEIDIVIIARIVSRRDPSRNSGQVSSDAGQEKSIHEPDLPR